MFPTPLFEIRGGAAKLALLAHFTNSHIVTLGSSNTWPHSHCPPCLKQW